MVSGRDVFLMRGYRHWHNPPKFYRSLVGYRAIPFKTEYIGGSNVAAPTMLVSYLRIARCLRSRKIAMLFFRAHSAWRTGIYEWV